MKTGFEDVFKRSDSKKMFFKCSVLYITLLLSFQLFAQDQPTALQQKIQQHRNSPDSLEFYAKQLYKEAVTTKDQKGIVNALMALGSVEMRRGNLKASNRYYHKLIKVADSSDLASFGYGALSNLAMNHRRLNRNDSAFYYFKKVNGFYSKTDVSLPANQARMNLGISFFQYQELDSAYYYLRSSLKGFKALDHKRMIAQNQSLLAEVYYQSENYAKAIELADSSLVVSKAIAFKPNLARNYSLLSRSFQKLGDSAQAQAYAVLEDENRVKRPPNTGVGRLNDKYEAEMRDRRLVSLNKVDEDKAFYMSSFFIISLVSIFLIGISLLLVRRNKLIKLEVAELQQFMEKYSGQHIISNLGKTLVLKSKVVLNLNDILYLKSDGHYVDYFLVDKQSPEVDRNTLKNALVQLPADNFIRVHKSYIVNVDHIKMINSNKLMIDNGEWIPMSRTYKPLLKAFLNKK